MKSANRLKKLKSTILLILIGIFVKINLLIAQDRPNILWITIEDTSPQFIGCYGNDDASTPVIDKLAQEGVRFTNAFSTGTVCSPSRSTIITGVRTYKMGTGNHRSKYSIPDYIHGFPYYLKQQGYYTTNNSKTDYNVANSKSFIKDAWNESSNTASWTGREKDQPFFAVFNFNESHQSRTMTQPYDWYLENVHNQLPIADRIEENAFDLPPFYLDNPQMRKQFARVYNSIKLTDNRIGELLAKLESDNLKENTIIFFYADHGEGIPRGKTNGINLGYRVPFIIWFPEKYKQLSPWGTAGIVSDELINFEDLAPTIINLAGGKIPDHMVGRILIGPQRTPETTHLLLSSDRSDNAPDLVRTVTDGRFVYSRNFLPYMPQMRYIRYMEIGEIMQQMRDDYLHDKLNALQRSLFLPRESEVLYDINNDIWEEHNLVDLPEYQNVLQKMRGLLNEELIEARDVHFLPEYEIASISKRTSAYEYRLDPEKYPFEAIYKAASLSGMKGPEIAHRQAQFLKNNSKIIRYWAAVGFLSQDFRQIDTYRTLLTEALEDDYPPVAVTAATVLYNNFESRHEMELLKSYCKSDNMELALLTINYLLYVKNKSPFIETIEKIYNSSDRDYNVKSACSSFLRITGKLDLLED